MKRNNRHLDQGDLFMWADSHSEKLSTAVSTQTVIRAHMKLQRRTNAFVALIARGFFVPPKETGQIISLAQYRAMHQSSILISGDGMARRSKSGR